MIHGNNAQKNISSHLTACIGFKPIGKLTYGSPRAEMFPGRDSTSCRHPQSETSRISNRAQQGGLNLQNLLDHYYGATAIIPSSINDIECPAMKPSEIDHNRMLEGGNSKVTLGPKWPSFRTLNLSKNMGDAPSLRANFEGVCPLHFVAGSNGTQF